MEFQKKILGVAGGKSATYTLETFGSQKNWTLMGKMKTPNLLKLVKNHEILVKNFEKKGENGVKIDGIFCKKLWG